MPAVQADTGHGETGRLDTDLAAVLACEERLVNLWPALDTLLIGGWVARFANGYSGRANSLSPIIPGAGLDAPTLAHVEALYRQAGLAPAIRLTPLAAAGLEPWLTDRGWSPVTRSIGMISAGLNGATPAQTATVTLESVATQAWIDGVSQWQEPSKRNPLHLAAIVSRIRLPAAFATVRDDGAPIGYGMAALDRGMAEIGSIIIAPEARGRGAGRALVAALLGWASAAGAGRVFLQVERSNDVARRLYASYGFVPLYAYTELRPAPARK